MVILLAVVMKKSLFIGILFSLFVSLTVFAVNVQQFSRSATPTYEMVDDAPTRNSHVWNDHDMTFLLGISYVDSPLTIKPPGNTSQIGTVLENMFNIHIGASINLTRDLRLGAHTYFGFFEGFFNGAPYGGSSTERDNGLSDIFLDLKWRFITKEFWAMSVKGTYVFPTDGGEIDIATVSGVMPDAVLSDESHQLGIKFIYERYYRYFNLAFNLGYRYAKHAEFDDMDFRHRVLTGAGTYIPLYRSWGMNLEWNRQWTLPLFNSNQNPNELYGGLVFGITKRLNGFVGLGFGNVLTNFDGNDWRASAGLKWSPRVWTDQRLAIKPIEEPVAPQCRSKYIFSNTNAAIVRFPNDVAELEVHDGTKEMASRITTRLDDVSSVLISGHASSPASNSYNLDLSQRRAKNTKDFLSSQGVPTSIMQTMAEGEEKLIHFDDLTSFEKQAINRRAEIVVNLLPDRNYCEDIKTTSQFNFESEIREPTSNKQLPSKPSLMIEKTVHKEVVPWPLFNNINENELTDGVSISNIIVNDGFDFPDTLHAKQSVESFEQKNIRQVKGQLSPKVERIPSKEVDVIELNNNNSDPSQYIEKNVPKAKKVDSENSFFEQLINAGALKQ